MMTQTINKVILVGHIINEPRWHITHGKRILHFNVLTREPMKRGEDITFHEETHQIRLSEQSANLDVVKKDQTVFVQGKIHTRQFIDTDNIKRYHTEIMAYSVDLITTYSMGQDLSTAS